MLAEGLESGGSQAREERSRTGATEGNKMPFIFLKSKELINVKQGGSATTS